MILLTTFLLGRMGGGQGTNLRVDKVMYTDTVDVCIPYMCQGLNSHYFHIIGDGHQPNRRGLYTHYKDSY